MVKIGQANEESRVWLVGQGTLSLPAGPVWSGTVSGVPFTAIRPGRLAGCSRLARCGDLLHAMQFRAPPTRGQSHVLSLTAPSE
jgi:hypothetical protein